MPLTKSDIEVMLVQHMARVFLDAKTPISIDSIFDLPEGTFTIKVPGKRWQRRTLENLISHNYISKFLVNKSEKYEAVDLEFLNMASVSNDPAGPELFNVEEYEKMTDRYTFKQAERYGRICVAYRALKRLVVTPDKQSIPRSIMFIPKKGNKFEEKAAWTPTWQDLFLEELLKLNTIEQYDNKGVTNYRILDQAKIQDILNGANGICVHTLLWPGESCTQDHSGPVMPKFGESNLETTEKVEAVAEVKDAAEQLVVEKKVEEVKPESLSKFGLRHSRNFRSSATATESVQSKESDKTTELEVKEDDSHQMDKMLLDALFNHLKTQDESLKTMLQFVTEVSKKLDDMESSIESLYNMAVNSMKSELGESRKEYKTVDSQINNMRKRLGEIERVSTQSDQTITAMSSEQKSALSEMAVLIVKMKQSTDASQASVQERFKIMEKSVGEIHNQNHKIGTQMSELEDKISTKDKSKLPLLLKKLGAVADELEILKITAIKSMDKQ